MGAVDESFKRPGSVPFKWEVQPGIPKQEDLPPPAAGDTTAAPAPGLPPTTPKLALPPAARVSALPSSASCRRSSSASSAPVSPPTTPTTTTLPPPPPHQHHHHHHRRSMSARFATSLAALPFTRRPRRGRAVKDDVVDHCLLYSEKIA